MYFTYVVRPGEVPHGRTPSFYPFWEHLLTCNLRAGWLLQILAFSLLIAVSLFGGKKIGFLFLTISDVRMTSSGLALLGVIAGFLWLAGACCLQAFRNTGDDEGSIKYSRGYRGGVKLLTQASALDIIQAAMLTLFFYGQLNYFEDQWQTDAIQPNAMVIFGLATRLLHAFACIFYAGSLFLIEQYHPEGSGEVWGWTLGIFFKVTGMVELAAILLNLRALDLVFTIMFFISLLAAFTWSLQFEPLTLQREVTMHQSALRNEWFKSRNAMAYYGPPIQHAWEVIPQSEPPSPNQNQEQ